MSKITEKRMREIVVNSIPDSYHFTSAELKEVSENVANHPEIQKLFEDGEDIVVQDVNHPYCPKRKCGMRQQNTEKVCLFCGADLVTPEIEEDSCDNCHVATDCRHKAMMPAGQKTCNFYGRSEG